MGDVLRELLIVGGITWIAGLALALVVMSDDIVGDSRLRQAAFMATLAALLAVAGIALLRLPPAIGLAVLVLLLAVGMVVRRRRRVGQRQPPQQWTEDTL